MEPGIPRFALADRHPVWFPAPACRSRDPPGAIQDREVPVSTKTRIPLRFIPVADLPGFTGRSR